MPGLSSVIARPGDHLARAITPTPFAPPGPRSPTEAVKEPVSVSTIEGAPRGGCFLALCYKRRGKKLSGNAGPGAANPRRWYRISAPPSCRLERRVVAYLAVGGRNWPSRSVRAGREAPAGRRLPACPCCVYPPRTPGLVRERKTGLVIRQFNLCSSFASESSK